MADRELRCGVDRLMLTGLFVVSCAVMAHAHPVRALVVAGLITLGVLGARVLVLLDDRRQQALDLIVEGHEALAIPAVARLRRVLFGRERRRLAVQLEDALAEADARASMGEPADGVPALGVLREEVEDIVAMLGNDRLESARGVALTAVLLRDGPGWLACRGDADGLRRELGRIRFFLARS